MSNADVWQPGGGSSSSVFVNTYQNVREYTGDEITIYSRGGSAIGDGGQRFWQFLTGQAPGFYVDDNLTVLLPVGGDGSSAWINNVEEELEGSFVPLAGTQVAAPMTGIITWDGVTKPDFSIGVLNGINDTFTMAGIAGAQMNIALSDGVDQRLWVYDVDGSLILPDIDYASVPGTAAVSKAYVQSLTGGTPESSIPLGGTTVGNPVTGKIEFDNVALDENWNLGFLPGVTDSFTLYTGATTGVETSFVISNRGSLTIFANDGEVLITTIPFASASATAVVSKAQLELNFLQILGSVAQDVTGLKTFKNGLDVEGVNLNVTENLAVTKSINSAVLVNTGEVLKTGSLGAIEQAGYQYTDVALLSATQTFTGHCTFQNVNGIDVLDGNIECTQSISATVSLNAGNLGTADRMLKTQGGLGGIVMSGLLESDISLVGHVHSQYALLTGGTFSGNITCPDFDCTGQAAAGSLFATNLSPSGVNLVAGGLGSIVPDASDVRLKESIYDCTYGLDAILQLKPVGFNWKAGTGRAKGRQVGFIAQDVQGIIPEAVPYSAEHDLYGFQDRPIIAALVNAMKEQQAMIETMQAKLEAIEANGIN